MFTYKSLLLPVLFSLFIYLDYFELSLKLIDTFAVLLSFLIFFTLSKKELFISGFFTGVLWFWWMGYSFVYYDLAYLIPVVLISIGFLYGSLFYITGFFTNIYFKVIYLFALSFIEPFGFNWFKLELPLINSYLGTTKIELFTLLLVSALFIQYRSTLKLKATLIYTLTILSLYGYNKFYNINEKLKTHPLKVYQYQTSIDQAIKWNKRYQKDIINDNLKMIDNAIKNKYDLIILPETAFPLILNKNTLLLNNLLEKSKQISIITGSLYQKEYQLYNSTYLFQNNIMHVAHKVVLVPFGEAVPLPEKLRDWINDIFYNGAQDYITAKEPTTFDIKGTKFRNAICYEATTDDVYQNLDTSYVIAISNNGWFTPSMQPNLQKLLMKYYANKYNLFIYNVSNQ